jgi:hypothetical protein
MRKVALLLIFIAALAGSARAFHYDITLEEIPMMILGTDPTNASFYSFYNIANLGAMAYLDDQSFLKFRLKDTYFELYSTNDLYIDRLSCTYYSDSFGILAGRDYYAEGDGILIGNLADGLRANLNLLGLRERFYAYYSGLLPREINQFNMTLSDLLLTNGPQRIFGGIVLEGPGLAGESIGATFLYSADLSGNYSYDPVYIGLNGRTSLDENLAIEANVIGETGMLNQTTPILAYGGNIALYYLEGTGTKFGAMLKASLASGDNNSGSSYNEFDTYGQYNTGIVLGPKFANLFFAQLGFLVKTLGDNLTFNVSYYYFMRMTTNDSVNNFYDGSGYQVGDEISGNIIYNIDPNFMIFVTGGYFIEGDAFQNASDRFMFIAGADIKI